MSLLPETFIVKDPSGQLVVIPRESIVTIHFPTDIDGNLETTACIILSSITNPERGNDVIYIEGKGPVEELFKIYYMAGGRMLYGKKYELTEPKVDK